MARPCRLQGENCFYHVTSRGDDRKKIYISEYDYKKFFEYLLTAKEKFKFHLYAWCLMTNHYHLFLETLQPNLSRIMQYINTSYTAYYNAKRRRCGHVFQGRYKSILVDQEAYFLELTRYIHLNPVKAKVVTSPGKYHWSSYKGYLNRKGDGYIDKDRIKQYLNMSSNQYRRFVLEGIGKEWDPFKNVYAGFLLGPVKFIKEKLKCLGEQIETKEFAHKKKLKEYVKKEDIIEAVAKKYGKRPEELCRMKNRPMTQKQIAIYLLKRFTGLTNKEIGEIFGMKYSAVSKAALNIRRLMPEKPELKQEVEGITSNFEA